MNTTIPSIALEFDNSTHTGIKMCECERDILFDSLVMTMNEPGIDPQVLADATAAQSVIYHTLRATIDQLPFPLPCFKVLFIISQRQVCALRALLVAYQVMISESIQGGLLTELGVKELVDKAEKARKLAQVLSSNS